MDRFLLISDWHHFAILSLVQTADYRHEAGWVARRLGIRKQEAGTALDRLERIGLLVRDESGKIRRSHVRYTTSDGVTNLHLRKLHAQNLELARKSLENDPVEIRDITASTIAVNPDKLPQARALIRDFQDELSRLMESGTRSEVYKFCVQLFPLSHKLEIEQ
jgi:uncharacterized protein (TIGR02147 family)